MKQTRMLLIDSKWKSKSWSHHLWADSFVTLKSATHWLTSVWSHLGPMHSVQEMQITILAVWKANWQARAVGRRTCSCPCVSPIRQQMQALAQGTFCGAFLLKSQFWFPYPYHEQGSWCSRGHFLTQETGRPVLPPSCPILHESTQPIPLPLLLDLCFK